MDDLKEARKRKNRRTARENLAAVREAIQTAERVLKELRDREALYLKLIADEPPEGGRSALPK